MKFWAAVTAIFLLTHPLIGDDAPLQEFDDDAFLSSKTPDSLGLVGWSLFKSGDEDKYIINFNSVSIIEYLRFVSKISNVNFQFEQGDLDFTITVVSEEPLSVQNILSALIQTLRARGFNLLEQDNNLMITKSADVKQIPTILSPEHPDNKMDAPIVTRIFRIKNANLNSLASIIRPMMSRTAMLDVALETRQLIVTDVTTNVDKIATLLQSLDSPSSPLEMEIYKARHLSADTLVSMTQKLIEPFISGSPFTLVAQPETNTVFVVSTPELAEKAVEMMEDFDANPKEQKGPFGNQVFLYPIVNKSPDDLLDALEEVADELKESGSQSVQLIAALESAKWIKDSNSILFITDTPTQLQLLEILKTLDTVTASQNFIIYKIQQAGKEQIEKSLEQLAKSLKRGEQDRDLIDAIQSMRYIKETNSFVFTGNEEALKKLKDLLPTFDSGVAKFSPSSHFWLYTPKYLSGKELENAIEDLDRSLKSSGLSDQDLLDAIKSMKWVPSTNTLLFTGTPASLEHIQAVLTLIDIPSGSPSKIFLYKPRYINYEQIENALDELADKLDHKNLSDRNLAHAIDSLTWIAETRTFLFKADPSSIEKIETFLKDIDNLKEAEAIANAYYLYKLKYAQGDDVIDQLETIPKSLPEKDPPQKAIIDVIDRATFLKDTNAILLTGSQHAVEEVKILISQFDLPNAVPPSLEKTSFYIYKPKYLTASELEEALQETAKDLKRSGLVDRSLLQSIDTMKVVELTDSLVFTGTKESLEKTKEIIKTIDIASEKGVLEQAAEHNFFIYKARYVPVGELYREVQNLAQNLQKEFGDANRPLIKSLRGAREIKETDSIIFTGPPTVLEKITTLMKQLDIPGEVTEGEVAKEPGTYVVYKPVNVSGPELIEMMSDFELNLKNSGVKDSPLFETINSLKYIQRTGYILVSGEQKAVDKALELLRKFDVSTGTGTVTSLTQLETSFLVYKLQYHQGSALQETLKKVGADLSAAEPQASNRLLKAINTIQWIKMTNSLLATGPPDVLTQLKELIQNIDVPLRQVFLEVLIIRTTLVNNQQFGLQWGSKFQFLNRFAGGGSNFPSPTAVNGASNSFLAAPLAAVNATRTPLATDIPNPGTPSNALSLPGGFDLGIIGDIILHKGKSFVSLASLVSALQADSDAVIVMNPKIVAQDNQQSTIFVGQNIPFAGSQVTNTQGNQNLQQTNIEYRDVGTNLTITPILGVGEVITLDISSEITEQTENTTGTASDQLRGLQTTRTSLNARVHVPNKHFLALSGMISDRKTHSKSGIPCLGGLPVIGAIFADNNRFNSRDNLIYFIRPVIIDSVEEFEKITDNQEALYKDLGSKQIIKEEIDDAIDWVRDPYCD